MTNKELENKVNELEEENQQLKDQVKKAYQEGLLQKQFDKDMEIQELKDKIEFLTTFKEVISEHKPAFCKLAGRDCEWLGKEKQLAIDELTRLKDFIDHNIEIKNDIGALKLQEFYGNQIKSLKGKN